MASVIIARTISAATEKAIAMENSAFARTLSIGTSWTKLRVGIRFHFRDLGSAPSGTPRFAIGLCSGTTNIMGDASVTHWVGLITDTLTWGYAAGSHYGSISLNPAKKVGSTLTVGAALTSAMGIPARAADNVPDRMMLFADIEKGSPNFAFSSFWPGPISSIDASRAQFLSRMEEATPSAFSTHTFTTGGSLAVDEADGVLNAINIAWDRASFAAELCDIAVARLV